MYYHSRDLKHVVYGVVYPPPLEYLDIEMLRCYKWLGHYCGFFPQVWLSRSCLKITGFKNMSNKDQDPILFAFDVIKGFPVAYDMWELIMNIIFKYDNFEDQNHAIIKRMIERIRLYDTANIPYDMACIGWIRSGRNLDQFLKNYLFVEKDQVVVPSLNLKSAKEIICRNERQKKELRKMGFIEDRITIKNFSWSFF